MPDPARFAFFLARDIFEKFRDSDIVSLKSVVSPILI